MIDFENVASKNFSVLGKNCVMKGEFHMSGLVNISSDMEGNLFVEDEGKVFIEKQASFSGNIKCLDIEIFGAFEGNIDSSGTVIIQPTANVQGKINASKLSIYPGADVNIEGHAQ